MHCLTHTYIRTMHIHTQGYVHMCILLPQPCKITAKFHSEVMLYRNQGCILMLFMHVGLRQWDTKQFCTQLTKAYVAKTPCSQLLLIEFAMYIRTYVYAQDQFAGYQTLLRMECATKTTT